MGNHYYELQFEIENECLLDCIHCSSADMRKSGVRKYTDDNLINFISLFNGPTHIYFTGGEPLLYKNILPLSRRISKNHSNIAIGFYSTGNCDGMRPISEAFANEMKASGIADCFFSIYSDSRMEHDAWTNGAGSFNNTLTSIDRLKAIDITPKAHLVLTPQNCHKISRIISFCQIIGIEEVRILKLTPSGNAKKNWDQIGIPLANQEKIIRQIMQEKDEYVVPLSFSGYPTLHPCRSFQQSEKCQAGTNLLYIDADGDIYPCACTRRDPAKFKICNLEEVDAIKQYIAFMADKTCNEICLNELR